jgi:hypothetical protein
MADKLQTISAAQLCAFTGYTDKRHRQLANQGYFPPPENGKYQTGPTIAGLFKHFREQLAKKSDSVRKLDERIKTAKCEKAEAETALIVGKFIAKAEIGPALNNFGLNQRALFVRKLEQELPTRITGLSEIEVRALMSAAVDEICATFETNIHEWLEQPPSAT